MFTPAATRVNIDFYAFRPIAFSQSYFTLGNGSLIVVCEAVLACMDRGLRRLRGKAPSSIHPLVALFLLITVSAELCAPSCIPLP